jgi:hypothetical protein
MSAGVQGGALEKELRNLMGAGSIALPHPPHHRDEVSREAEIAIERL